MKIYREKKSKRSAETASNLSFDYNTLKNFKIDKEVFRETFEKLLKKWWNSDSSIPDCDGKRFVQSFLFGDLLNPLKLSAVADDLINFQLFYQEESDGEIFELCCICGAEQIMTTYLLKDEIAKKTLVDSENIIAYALSSGKREFALNLAIMAQKLGRTDPGPIELYTFSSHNFFFFLSKIEEIFLKKPETESKNLFLEEKSQKIKLLFNYLL